MNVVGNPEPGKNSFGWALTMKVQAEAELARARRVAGVDDFIVAVFCCCCFLGLIGGTLQDRLRVFDLLTQMSVMISLYIGK